MPTYRVLALAVAAGALLAAAGNAYVFEVMTSDDGLHSLWSLIVVAPVAGLVAGAIAGAEAERPFAAGALTAEAALLVGLLGLAPFLEQPGLAAFVFAFAQVPLPGWLPIWAAGGLGGVAAARLWRWSEQRVEG